MEKLRMTSPDMTDANIDKLAELFPSVLTETVEMVGDVGVVKRAINFDLLRQQLSDHIVEGPQERYQLDWPGKRAAAFAANAPIAKTLRPAREKSVDFDSTENLFIEGDNLDVLKLLQESYLGKIKLIYIDPPYNTGKDFVYADKFAASTQDYLATSGQTNGEGAQLIANSESNGRFHSDWLSMMYPRLKLARNLLADDGVLFVSIDDHEVANLRRLLDELYGEANFVENYIWESNFRPDNSSRLERENAQHILCYARRRSQLPALVGAQKATEGLPSLTKSSMKATTLKFNPDWVEFQLRDGTYQAGERGSGYVLGESVTVINGRATASFTLTGRVIWSQSYLEQQVAEGTRIVIKSDGFVPYSRKVATSALAPTTLIPRDKVGDVLAGNAEIRGLFGSQVFNHPKPTTLLRYLISSVTSEDKCGIILDFFAGSGSTAHAVMAQNAEDGGSRRFVMVQLDEITDQNSYAAKSGYKSIAELSRERIRRAGPAVAQSAGLTGVALDVGFRVLRVDSTSMADVLRTPDETGQAQLAGVEESIKSDRTGEDLLFQVLLDWGLELTMPVTVEQLQGHEVFIVDDDALIACFESDVSPDLVRAVAQREPLRAVFRDSGFASDDARINAEQIFQEVSPATDVKAI